MTKCDTSKLDAPLTEKDFIGDLTFHQFTVGLAAIFTLVASLLSFYLIFRHATNYTRPTEQKHILRILFMVPVYSLVCCLSVKYYKDHVYLEAIHQFYEALVLAAFFMLLCRYVAPDLRSLKEEFRTIEVLPWIPPIRWLSACTGRQKGPFRTPRSGVTLLNVIWLCVFQYSLIKLLTTLLTFVTEAAGVFCASSMSTSFAHVWITIAQSLSLIVAMVCLTQFYFQLRDPLRPHNPFLKFLAFKLVILVAYIQTFILDTLTGDDGAIKPSATIGYASWKVGIPNALLCAEMAGVAVLHLFAYPWAPYAVSALAPQPSSPSSSKIDGAEEEQGIPMQQQQQPWAGASGADTAVVESGGQVVPLVSQGGRFGLRAVGEMLNFWDYVAAVARAGRWLVVGRKQREMYA